MIRTGRQEPVATESFYLSESGNELVLEFSVTEAQGTSLDGSIVWALPGVRLKKAALVHSSYGIPARVRFANRFAELLVFSAGQDIIHTWGVGACSFTFLPMPPMSSMLALAFQADTIAALKGIGYSLSLQRLLQVRAFSSGAGVLELQWYGKNACIVEGHQIQLRHGSKVVCIAEFLGRNNDTSHWLG